MKKKSMLTKLIVGFLLYLVIPMLIIDFIFYYYMKNYSEKEISRSNIGRLTVIKNMNVMFLDGIRQNALRLSLSSALYDLNEIDSYTSSYSSSDNLVKMSHTIDTISEFIRTDNKLHSIYLYLDDNDFVLTTNNGVMLKSEFKDKSWLENFERYKSGKSNVLWTKPRIITDYLNKDYIISYIYPLTGYTTNLRGALVVNLKEAELSKLINNNSSENEGGVSIIDSEGTILSSVNKSELGVDGRNVPYINRIINANSKQGSINADIDGKVYLVTYYKSDFNDWTYLNISSLDYLSKAAGKFKLLIACTFGVLFFIGFLTSILFSKKLYTPVDRLVKRIKKQRGLPDKDTENEMSILYNAFDALTQSEDDLKKYVEKNLKTVKEQNVIKLLNGSIADCDRSSILFNYSGYKCVCLSIDKYSRFIEVHSIEERYYTKSLIVSICEEVFKNNCNCYCIDLDNDKLAMILNFDRCLTDDNKDTSLIKLLGNLQSELTSVIDTSVTIGVGEYFEDLKNINKSYKQALELLKMKLVIGYGKIIQWNSDFYNLNEYFYPYNEEKHIFNQLSLRDKENTKSAVKNFFSEIRCKSSQGLAIDNVIQIIHQLTANTIKYLFDSCIMISDVLGHNVNIYEQLNSIEILEKVEEWFQQLYSSIIDYCNNRQQQDCQYIRRIIEYIDKNYQKDIGIETIADNVGMSYSYARKIFKEKTGKSMVDYLNIKRIEKAKEFLQKSDYGIMDIALKVGYNNDQSFNRFFKKYEGVSPSDFRRKSEA